MNPDWHVCSRARLARDARFDGKFFIGVLTTRIYCRPICRTRTSKESNVRYFPTTAAAPEASFRPCSRCRPECSPGTPAWAGTRNTVSRALQLISESGLEDGGVERLGVGSRHLRRFFLRHLGATPSAVAQTRRLHFAKRLIDETRLPMGQIVVAAGFGWVRRFNAGILKVYRRTPTQIRRLARQGANPPENQYAFHLNFRPPYNWSRYWSFWPLAPRQRWKRLKRALIVARALARSVNDGKITLDGIADCGTLLKRLYEVPGIVKWTAQYVAMRVLRDPDAFPATELASRRILANCTTHELEHRSEAWRPWRAYAAMLLWQSLAQPATAVPRVEAPRNDAHLPPVSDV